MLPLLKWIGSKHRSASAIIAHFPPRFGRYLEPFLGSGAVLGALAPERGWGSDAYTPLMEIWNALKTAPETLIAWYAERYALIETLGKDAAYETVKASFNRSPNGADFVFLVRTCYGGVVRFRRQDGYMSTPCGAHRPIAPAAFARRVAEWAPRVAATSFVRCDFTEALEEARPGDLVYCDPPYSFSQSIVYGAHAFKLETLLDHLARAKARGVFGVLSIDGTAKSGSRNFEHALPDGLFEREVSVSVGRSMLRRFQKEGQSLEDEHVTDKLLLTY
jgi:DNA adenine methylase